MCSIIPVLCDAGKRSHNRFHLLIAATIHTKNVLYTIIQAKMLKLSLRVRLHDILNEQTMGPLQFEKAYLKL